jgi:hypothetical protein
MKIYRLLHSPAARFEGRCEPGPDVLLSPACSKVFAKELIMSNLLRALTTAVVPCAFVATAQAKEFQLPDANPAVSVTLPDSWKPEAIDTGAEATSPDGGAYIALETSPAKGVNDLIDSDIEFLKKNKVTIDPATQQSQDTKVNGMPVTFLRWTGKDEDGPTAVTLVIFGVSDKLILLMTAWASPAAEKKFSADLDSTVASVKPIK